MDINEHDLRVVIAGLEELPIKVALQTYMKLRAGFEAMHKDNEQKASAAKAAAEPKPAE